MKRVLSGMQSSGQLTIGNYIGALRNFVKLQELHRCYFMVVDMHAITVPQDPAALREQTESIASLYIASARPIRHLSSYSPMFTHMQS